MKYLVPIEQYSLNNKIKYYPVNIRFQLPFMTDLSKKSYEFLKKQALEAKKELYITVDEYYEIALNEETLGDDVFSSSEIIKDIIRRFEFYSFEFKNKYYIKLICNFGNLESFIIYDYDEYYNECAIYVDELIESNLAKIEEGELCFV